ncbi:HEAT repeat domain-containing protein [Actinacidiphila sp. bgisy160]|uniref:HEAT repeat domain-containing protein n=1 Tax=Actinacidiphila sp. bgisy160 TaxID=3413796 RepID=UPI003D725B99
MSANDATAALPDPAALLPATDWAALSHAYGPADGTPYDLLGLLHDDPEVQAESFGRLEMSVLHQGSLYSATAPAALFVAAILNDPRTLAVHESFFPWDDRVRPLRAALLEWLGELADSAAYEDDEDDEDDGDDGDDGDDEESAEEIAAIEACRAVRPQLFDAVAPWLDDADATVREAALGAVTHLLRAPELADRVPAAAGRLERIAKGGGDRRERAGALLSLGAWGHDTGGFLTDPDPAVRACAALGTTGPGAVPALLDALADPGAADAWFDEPLPQFDGWFRFTLLRGLLGRARHFDEVLPAALALAPMYNQHTVDSEWGPLLALAFPTPYVPGHPLTDAQRAFLRVLVDQDACWGNIANRVSWLRAAGLPSDREPLRDLLAAAPPGTS